MQPHTHRDLSRSAPRPQPCTYFVTTLILTPKTPVCFLDGVLFKLMSLLVNFMENSTLICRRQGVSRSSLALARHLRVARRHRAAPGKGLQAKRGAVGPCGPTYPVHLDHVHVPVLRLHSLRVQLRGEMLRELCRNAAPCQPRCHRSLVAPEAPDPQTALGTGHALPQHVLPTAGGWRRKGLGSPRPCPKAGWAQPPCLFPLQAPARQRFNPHPSGKKFPRNQDYFWQQIDETELGQCFPCRKTTSPHSQGYL